MKNIILDFLVGAVVLAVVIGVIGGAIVLEKKFGIDATAILCLCGIVYVIGWAIRD